MERTEEERQEQEEKFPKSTWIADENKIWEEDLTARKNGTCLTPTQKSESDWTEVKGKKKESKENKKKLRKKKKDTTVKNRFDGLDISPSTGSSDESTNRKK